MSSCLLFRVETKEERKFEIQTDGEVIIKGDKTYIKVKDNEYGFSQKTISSPNIIISDTDKNHNLLIETIEHSRASWFFFPWSAFELQRTLKTDIVVPRNCVIKYE